MALYGKKPYRIEIWKNFYFPFFNGNFSPYIQTHWLNWQKYILINSTTSEKKFIQSLIVSIQV